MEVSAPDAESSLKSRPGRSGLTGYVGRRRAEALLQKAMATKPDDYRAWFDLGYIYRLSQRPGDAIVPSASP